MYKVSKEINVSGWRWRIMKLVQRGGHKRRWEGGRGHDVRDGDSRQPKDTSFSNTSVDKGQRSGTD